MKRSSQIGLAATGVLLVATVWSMTSEDPQENLVYNSLSDCRAAGQQCDVRVGLGRLQQRGLHRPAGRVVNVDDPAV